MTDLLDETKQFFLRALVRELSKEIDWRARAFRRNVLVRFTIYLAALVRDLVRIPLHHPQGIGQARFRLRVVYIRETALPTLHFFLQKYPLEADEQAELSRAIELLEAGAALTRDGAVRAIDEWYATIEEFGQLTRCSRAAAEAIGVVANTAPCKKRDLSADPAPRPHDASSAGDVPM